VRFPLLQSFSRPYPPCSRRPNPCELDRRCRAPSLGFPSSSRHQQAASTSCERPRLAMFRPRRFARPRRLTPPPALWVYFTPLPRPGFALQGFSRPHSRTSSSLADPLVTLAPSPCNRLPDHARGVRSPSGCSLRGSPTAPRRRLAYDSPAPLLSFAFLGFCFAHQEDSGLSASVPRRPRPWLSLALDVLPVFDLTYSCESASPVQGFVPSPPSPK